MKIRETTAFPHADIPEEGPALTPALCRFSRDDLRYWRHVPRDHDVSGDFAGVLQGATEVEACSLDILVGYTYCEDDSATADGRRRRYVRDKALEAQKHAVRSGHGLYGRPRKPATSGRKKRAA